jgi:hydroxyethylthiazole kinase-like uncharacterized protein yjeF
MQKVFDEVGSLDKRCYEKFSLTEDILMEHAAISMLDFIEEVFDEGAKILIVSGTGNNGADGIVLARLLQNKYEVNLFLPFGAKSQMAKVQLKRAELIGVDISISYSLFDEEYDLVVDCLFGSGLNRELDKTSIKIIDYMNSMNAYKLSCDVPSGIDSEGKIENNVFSSNTTITMGALKKSLFSDEVKEYVGQIVVANLGVQRSLYEGDTDCYLLDMEDLELPTRDNKTTHKGTFGHLSVILGSKSGAGMLSAMAAFNLGAGLVSVIDHENITPPYHIMHSHKIPSNTTAIAIGMGLGNYEKNEIIKILKNDTPKIIDADLFYKNDILNVLGKDNIVLTPHPKEFCSLLKLTEIADIKVKKLQKDRFKYLKEFCKKYPNVVLLLKGANVLIGKGEKTFINPHGTSALSFGGSGDVLGGFIGSLLAQGYSSLESAIFGSLIHTKTALNYEKNDYSLTPNDLIEGVKDI